MISWGICIFQSWSLLQASTNLRKTKALSNKLLDCNEKGITVDIFFLALQDKFYQIA